MAHATASLVATWCNGEFEFAMASLVATWWAHLIRDGKSVFAKAAAAQALQPQTGRIQLYPSGVEGCFGMRIMCVSCGCSFLFAHVLITCQLIVCARILYVLQSCIVIRDVSCDCHHYVFTCTSCLNNVSC